MRKKWGEQWDAQSMDYLLDSGPNPLFENVLLKVKHKKCLVLGAGGEVAVVNNYCDSIVAVNISKESLKRIKNYNIDLIIADAERLPIKDSCTDIVICKSTLHHLQHLNHSIEEIKRVAIKGADLFLYEPNQLNFLAFLGRKLFPTEIHDPTEKPFNPFVLRNTVSKNFEIINETDFFVFVHFIPVMQKILNLNNYRLVMALNRLDTLLCKTYFKNLSWILVFTLRKK